MEVVSLFHSWWLFGSRRFIRPCLPSLADTLFAFPEEVSKVGVLMRQPVDLQPGAPLEPHQSGHLLKRRPRPRRRLSQPLEQLHQLLGMAPCPVVSDDVVSRDRIAARSFE